MKKDTLFKLVVGLLLCVTATLVLGQISDHVDIDSRHESTTSTKTKKIKKAAVKKTVTKKAQDSTMQKPINWRKSSETKAYPDVKQAADFWIKVSTEKERVYLMDGSKKLYTMYASTGSKDQATPKGTWHIQYEKGDFFYNQESGEGAKYWVSFKDHGVYLFHSVPTDQEGNFIEKEAQQLGKKAASHGCVRLSVPDAKWFYQNIPPETKVVIS